MTADPTGQYVGARQVIGSMHHLGTADPTSPYVSDEVGLRQWRGDLPANVITLRRTVYKRK
jgi:hypothetical protein